MNTIEVIIYTDQGNNAVVRLPERKYPGVVVQGDTLLNITSSAEKLLIKANELNDEELIDVAEEVFFELKDILESFKVTVHESRLDIPYLK